MECTKLVSKIFVDKENQKDLLKPLLKEQSLACAKSKLKKMNDVCETLYNEERIIPLIHKNCFFVLKQNLILDFNNKIKIKGKKVKASFMEWSSTNHIGGFFSYAVREYAVNSSNTDFLDDKFLKEIYDDINKNYKDWCGLKVDLLSIPEIKKIKDDGIELFPSMAMILGKKTIRTKQGEIFSQSLNKTIETNEVLNIKDSDDIYVPVCYRLPKKETVSKSEWIMKYELIPENKETNGKDVEVLCKLSRNNYIQYKNGRFLFTEEGEKSIFDGKSPILPLIKTEIGEKKKQLISDKKGLSVSLNKMTKEEKEKILRSYLDCDKIRANMRCYDLKQLEDPNMGHWDLWEENIPKQNCAYLEKRSKIYARNPLTDIDDSVVGIDFGTKSTVVVCQGESGDIKPMRIGCNDLKREISSMDFENPTIMQFINLNEFIKDYGDKEGRPYTKWKDLVISHNANENFKNAEIQSSDYYTYFSELKQWAGESEQKIILRDKQGMDEELPCYRKISESGYKIDPIEIYAYYIGLYVNNMNSGIHLEYLLSFPVTYEKDIRQKILNSFKRGIWKSLPESIQKSEIGKQFSVTAGVSEPAAYAICALEEYGFDPVDDQKYLYGIFDFGGGTTDFDFGVWTSPDDSDNYDYCLQHFGAAGDRYLGGENLLQLISFEVFKQNLEVCRKEEISFEKPFETKNVSVQMSGFVKHSQEARMNQKIMMEHLRPFWERTTKSDENKEQTNKKAEEKIFLFSDKGDYKANIDISIDYGKLEEILRARIEKGVTQFFHAVKLIFSDEKYEDVVSNIDQLNIFLAGNASKSIILKEIFDEKVGQWNKDINKDVKKKAPKAAMVIYPPLGTEEARQRQKDKKIMCEEEEFERPNGKTGVAWGVVEGRNGGRVQITDEIGETEETHFAYYLGIESKRKFKVKIDREAQYNKWVKFCATDKQGIKKKMEILYSSLPEATSEQLSVKDESVLRKRIDLPRAGEDAYVYIRLINPEQIELGIGDSNSIIDETTIQKIIF